MKNNSDMNIYKNIHCRQIFRTVVLLILFVCSVQSNWADEVIFSMSTTDSSTETVSNGGTIAGSTFADVKYGTVTYQNNNSTAYAAVSSSKFYLGTNTCYFKIELDKPLQTGDKIKLANMPLCSANGNQERLNGLCFCTSSERNTTYKTTDNITENVE